MGSLKALLGRMKSPRAPDDEVGAAVSSNCGSPTSGWVATLVGALKPEIVPLCLQLLAVA
jgi:hypothetical protein